MSIALEAYLDRVMLYANRPLEQAKAIRTELQDHLIEKVQRLCSQGISREDAIFLAVEQHGDPRDVGYGLRPLFSLVDIRTTGTARGVIAIGPRAVGIVAFGGLAFGVLAFGGIAAGFISIGGIAAGLLFAWAGMGIGAIAYAGIAVGLLALGGLAWGVIAGGQMATGLWVPHPSPWCSSYFTPATVPAWLTAFDGSLTNPPTMFLLTLIILPILFWLMLVPLGILRKEHQRVQVRFHWIVG